MTTRTTRKQLALRYGAVVALLVVVVVMLARLQPAEIDAEHVAASAPSTVSAAEDGESDTLSPPPPDAVERNAAPVAAAPRTSTSRSADAASGREVSFTLEVTVDAPEPIADVLGRATIYVDPDMSMGFPKRIQERASDCRRSKLQSAGRRVMDFDRLCGGTWTVSVRADGLEGESQKITCHQDGARVPVRLHLRERRVILVAIHDVAGAPLDRSALLAADVRAQLVDRVVPHVCEDTPRTPSNLRSSCTAALYRTRYVGENRDIAYEVETQATGPLWVGACFGDSILAWAAVPVGCRRVVLEVPAAAVLSALRSLEVRVRERDGGAAIAGVEVVLTMRGGAAVKLVTDAEGRARTDGVVVGTGSVRVTKAGYGAEVVPLDASADAPLSLEVELAAEVVLRGRLVGTDGTPVAGHVIAFADGADALPWNDIIGDEASAGSDGGFVLRGLARGSYLLADARVRGAGLRELARTAPSEGELARFVVRVDARHGSVSGIVVPTLSAKR